MVVFTCSTCGDSLKKSQVEKHIYTKCRSCKMLTCIDCNKDFWGDAYKEHIKCVTEAERYGGKNFKPQPFKGEAKQQQWIELLSKIIETQEMSPPVKDVFKRMQNFNNVPRKEKPLKNFLHSSMGVRNQTLAQDVWQTMKKAQETLQKTQPGNKHLQKPHVTDENGSKGEKLHHSEDKARGQQQQEEEETQDASNEDNAPGKKKQENGSAQVKVEKTKKSKEELLKNSMSDEVNSDKSKKKERKKRQQENVIEGGLQDDKEDRQDTSSKDNALGNKKRENGSAQVKVEKTKKSKEELLKNSMSVEVSSDKPKKKRKRKQSQQENVIEGGLQDDKEDRQDTSSKDNALGNKKQQNGSAQVKVEKTKKSKEELLKNSMSVSSDKPKKKRKRKQPQQENVIEGGLQDNKENKQDVSSKDNALGKKKQENGSAQVKGEKTKKPKKEPLDKTVSDEVASENSKKKKRKNRNQEDVIESDLQDEEKPTKKFKRQDQEGDNHTEKVDKAAEKVRFRWKNAVKRALLKADKHQLSRKQLQKRVFEECQSKGGNLTDEKMQTKLDKVLSNIRYFQHEGDLVRWVHSAAK